MNRHAAERRGHWGERRAAWWLQLHGWSIVARRVKARGGEIDIVARRWGTVAFVEVKTRATASELDLAIDQHRLKRVAAATHALRATYARPHDTVCIDVILIAPRHWPRHLKNIWYD